MSDAFHDAGESYGYSSRGEKMKQKLNEGNDKCMKKPNKAKVEECNEKLTDICGELEGLLTSKNEDYGDTCGDMYKKFGITYFLVMLEQKMMRMENIAKQGGESNYESLEDSLMDLAGYAIHTIKNLRDENE